MIVGGTGRHATPEGNTSTAEAIAFLRTATVPPDEERRPRNYRPRHRAVETTPLDDRPTPEEYTGAAAHCTDPREPDGCPWEDHSHDTVELEAIA